MAEEVGCAYWDAQAAMGGENSFGSWLGNKPKLASSDLSHLTAKGRTLIGETLSDMILYSYEQWKIENPNGVVITQEAHSQKENTQENTQ